MCFHFRPCTSPVRVPLKERTVKYPLSQGSSVPLFVSRQQARCWCCATKRSPRYLRCCGRDDLLHARGRGAVAQRGLQGPPLFLRSGDGPKFIRQAILDWIAKAGIPVLRGGCLVYV